MVIVLKRKLTVAAAKLFSKQSAMNKITVFSKAGSMFFSLNLCDKFTIHTGTALIISKTRLYNIDPLKPHFYIVKLRFIGVYITFLISAQNIDCRYSLEPPRRGGSNEYPQSMF